MKVKPLLQCHVLISVDSEAGAPSVQRFSTMEKLLARSGSREKMQGDFHGWLFHHFSLASQEGFPLAPLAAFGDGLEVGEDYWLYADPVHFLLLRDRMVLDAISMRDLAQEESSAIISSLNRHFSEDGMMFELGHPSVRWYLRLKQAPGIQTHPLPKAQGHDVEPLMPFGKEASLWRGRINEIQMLLHAHPVNIEREAHGKTPANSLWIWGGGFFPKEVGPAFNQVWSDEPLLCGLTKACGNPARTVPDNAGKCLMEMPAEGGCLVDLTGCDLAHVEQAWLEPLRSKIQEGFISTLHMHICSGSQVSSFSINSIDLWKIWRTSRPLGAYLND